MTYIYNKGGIKLIYTVTFNPALDYIVRLDKFTAGAINRVTYENVLGGGKGINVSIVLSNLGQKSTALGFVAGFTGEEIKRQLLEHNVQSDFVQLPKGFTRINVKVKAEVETEINGQGPDISEAKREELFAQLEKLGEGDTLVLSGSVPKTLPDDMYQQVLSRLQDKKIRIVVDAEKGLLLKVLQYKPWLIKPNNHELGDMFGVKLKSNEEIIEYAKKLQDMGAQNVLISMAGDGAILLTAEGQSYFSPAPKGTLVNSIGAGDSMVAGFITGYVESNGDYKKAFHMGVATGSASAFSENLATRPEVEALLKTIE